MSGFQHGELVICSKPYAYVLRDEFRGQRCEYCFKKQEDLKCCSQCSIVYFCNKACQAKGWALHKLECKLMKKAASKPSDSERFFSLLILKAKRHVQDDPYEEALGRKVTFGSLMSNSYNIKQNKTSYELMHPLMVGLNSYLGPENIPEPDDFLEIFGKMRVNYYDITDDVDEVKSIGLGLYLGASIFDHSCEPNAEFAFNGVNLDVRANKYIPHQDINKITVTYINRLQFTEERREELMTNYYFHCTCPRCTSSTYTGLLKETLFEENAEEHLAKAEEGFKRLKKMENEQVNPSSLKEACIKELQIQDGVLGNTNIYKIKILIIAFDTCTRLQHWADVIIFGNRLLDPYRLIYGPHSKVVGLLLMKLGISQIIQGLSAAARTSLNEAEDILKKTHGEEHPLYQDLVGVSSSVRQLVSNAASCGNDLMSALNAMMH